MINVNILMRKIPEIPSNVYWPVVILCFYPHQHQLVEYERTETETFMHKIKSLKYFFFIYEHCIYLKNLKIKFRTLCTEAI